MRDFAFLDKFFEKEVTKEIQKELIKNWIDSGQLRISPLGVNLSESDSSVMGSAALYVLTTWFFYCIRRENHLIARLLIDADQSHDDDLKLAVYHGINSYTVFTTIGDDYPIDRLRPPPPLQLSVAYHNPVFIALIFLPAITIAFMVGTDLLSLIRSWARGDDTLGTYFALGPFLGSRWQPTGPTRFLPPRMRLHRLDHVPNNFFADSMGDRGT
jgi:hypothetical protein